MLPGPPRLVSRGGCDIHTAAVVITLLGLSGGVLDAGDS